MRKTFLVAVLAATGGFCLASTTAFAVARYNIWHASGPQFQLGYVIGYLDAIVLAQRKDTRAQIATRNTKNFDIWITGVNKYFEDPANQKRTVADAMHSVGSEIREQWLKEWGKQRLGRDVSGTTPTPAPAP